MQTMKIKPFSIPSRSNRLRGVILIPQRLSHPVRTVIISHGFASNMLITSPYAKPFTDQGYIAVLYDFCMSGSGISSGKSTGMSVLTEAENLMDLIDYVKTLPLTDENHISLAGCSQGGLVSALTAAQREADIEALFLYYPALCIPDDARRGHMITARFDPENIPDIFYAINVKLSRKYADDAASLDPYDEICTFQKPVLIIHGIEDTLVDIDYSRKARDRYENCTMIEVHGDHGFIKSGLNESKKATASFLEKLNARKAAADLL